MEPLNKINLLDTNAYNYDIPDTENLNDYICFVTTGYCHRLKHNRVYLQSSFLTKAQEPITDVNIITIT